MLRKYTPTENNYKITNKNYIMSFKNLILKNRMTYTKKRKNDKWDLNEKDIVDDQKEVEAFHTFI